VSGGPQKGRCLGEYCGTFREKDLEKGGGTARPGGNGGREKGVKGPSKRCKPKKRGAT